jgi:glutamyl-tRNA reductase
MEMLAQTLSNKFTHLPSVCLREATISGRSELVESIRELFDLQEDD